MYKKIITNKKLPFKKRVKRFLLYYLKRVSGDIGWKKRYKKLLSLHAEYGKSDNRENEKAHQKTWSAFRYNINLKTYRVCMNISGKSSPNIIPEEIFVADLEPTLNKVSNVNYLTIKSLYNQWYTPGIFPQDFLHNIDGELLDQNLEPISSYQLSKLVKKLHYPLVFKPNIASHGGEGVFFPEDQITLSTLIQNNKNFVVQEKIQQHPFFERFNPKGLNTVRVCLYKSIKDNRLHFLNMALRLGVGGSLDNETAGGIVSYINRNGYLHGFAVDKFGKKFLYHPDTGLSFDQQLPDYGQLVSVSRSVASRIFYARLVSLDMAYDNQCNWRAIEINMGGQTIRFAQYAGDPFFGEFTSEIIEYCKANHWALD